MNRILLVSLFSLLLLPTGVWGQGGYWEEAPGPYGGWGSIIPTHSNLVYSMITPDVLYRSEDFGEHWEKFSVAQVDTASLREDLHIGHSGVFYKIVSVVQNFAVTRRLYHSLDEGATWILLDGNTPVSVLNETRTGVLVGSLSWIPGLFRSINGGLTWEYLFLPNVDLGSLYNLTSTTTGHILIYQTNSNKFLLSTDSGLTWAEQSAPAYFKALHCISSGTLFSLPTFGANTVRRSADAGLTWVPISIPLDSNETVQSILELNSSRLLATTNYGLYFSDDDGLSWHSVLLSTPERPHWLLGGEALGNGDIIGRTKGNSLCRSSDGGETWTFSSVGIRRAYVKQLHFLSDSLQMTTTYDGLWRTENAGQSWERLLADSSAMDPQASVLSTRSLAVLGRDSFVVQMGINLWASADGGASYTQVTPSTGFSQASVEVFVAKGAYLFCSDAENVVRSGDLGATWTTIIPNAYMTELAQHPTAGLFAFVIPKNIPLTNPLDVLLYHSLDDGASWTEITTLDIQANQRRALAVGADGKVYVTGYHGANDKLAISTDAGTTWAYKTVLDRYAVNFDLAVNTVGILFTPSLWHGCIIASADEGDTWYQLPEISTHIALIRTLQISPSGHLYIIPYTDPPYRSTSSTEIGAYITGHVRRDADAECSTPDAQAPLKNWVVSLEGVNNWYANTNADGRYTFFVDTGAYTVRAQPPQTLWWGLCEAEQTIQSDSYFSTDTVDFAAVATVECPLISVSVGLSLLRRCFDNHATVQYCNQGTETADNAWVDVILDEHLALVSADLPHTDLGANTYRFQLGHVPSGECGQFGLVVYVDCDSTVLGQTHCIAAHGYPDTLCAPVADWSGATVVAEAECQDSVVALRLRNISPVPSQVLPYIIIEDDVVLFQGQGSHEPSGVMTFERPANGHTWRIESQQEPGHPFSTVAVAFLEGCGGFESLGFVNQFEVNTFTPSWDRLCLENIGAYDPNDKQGFPLGYGEQHRIRPGQELDYLIRFQNTGTDTAFNVFIRDTLSPWLDPASVRPGASSHPYTWTLSGQGALQFTFANILLPDSNVNLAGSQGFVRFRVAQRPDVPIGAQIFNEAGIYFDFNAPVITNRTLHTVGIDYITGTSERPETRKSEAVFVSPNPALDEVVFQLRDGTEFNRHRIVLTDALGRTLRHETATGARHVLQRRGLPAGACFFRVEDANGRWTGAGKVWWR